jgi:hypothetical protein
MSSSSTGTGPVPAVTHEAFAKDLAELLKGKLDDDKLAAAAANVSAATTAYPAAAWFVSFVFYLHCECQVTGETPRFRGNAGGIWSPTVGAGGYFGNLYTDDKDKLYKQTASFEVHSAIVYCGMTFWDSNSTLLGHFESGGIGAIGVGGGTGKWSA